MGVGGERHVSFPTASVLFLLRLGPGLAYGPDQCHDTGLSRRHSANTCDSHRTAYHRLLDRPHGIPYRDNRDQRDQPQNDFDTVLGDEPQHLFKKRTHE